MSHLSYFALFVFVTVSFGRRWQIDSGNSMLNFPDMAIEIMGDCVVSGDQLIANEIPVRTLTAEEQAEVTQYNAQLQQVQQQFQQLSEQLRNLSETSANSATTVSTGNKGKGKGKGGKGGKSGRGGWATPSPAAQALINQIANLTGPAAPSFCNGSDTILYDFIGCSVQNYKVYVGRTFVRNLTTAEVTTMNTFINQSNAWEQWVMSQIQSQNFGGHGGMGGGNGGMGGHGGNGGMGGMGGGNGGMGGMGGGKGAHGSTTTPSLSKASSLSSVSASSSSSSSSPSSVSASSSSSPSPIITSSTSSPISSKPPFPTMPQFCTLF